MKLLFSLIILLITQLVSAQNSEVAWLKGSWSGSVDPPISTGGKSWDIVIKYSAENDVFMVNYPSLECGGTWNLEIYKDEDAEFVETITEGIDNCTDKMEITIHMISKNKIKINYYLPYSTVLEGSGTLMKIK